MVQASLLVLQARIPRCLVGWWMDRRTARRFVSVQRQRGVREAQAMARGEGVFSMTRRLALFTLGFSTGMLATGALIVVGLGKIRKAVGM